MGFDITRTQIPVKHRQSVYNLLITHGRAASATEVCHICCRQNKTMHRQRMHASIRASCFSLYPVRESVSRSSREPDAEKQRRSARLLTLKRVDIVSMRAGEQTKGGGGAAFVSFHARAETSGLGCADRQRRKKGHESHLPVKHLFLCS